MFFYTTKGAEAEGMKDLQEARKEKQTAEHSSIDDAIAGSATASSGSKPTSRLAPMAEQRESEKSSRYGSQTRGAIGTESHEDYEDNEPAVPVRSGGPSEDWTTHWARNLSTLGSSSGRTRNPPAVRRPPHANNPYDDPSSDAEYPETVMSGGYAEMTEIRVKLHYGHDTRGMVSTF
jgi:hypothetical protein